MIRSSDKQPAKPETVKAPDLFGGVVDTGRTEAQLNGWGVKGSGSVNGTKAQQGALL